MTEIFSLKIGMCWFNEVVKITKHDNTKQWQIIKLKSPYSDRLFAKSVIIFVIPFC